MSLKIPFPSPLFVYRYFCFSLQMFISFPRFFFLKETSFRRSLKDILSQKPMWYCSHLLCLHIWIHWDCSSKDFEWACDSSFIIMVLNFKKFASTLWCSSPIRNNSHCILRHSFGERWEQMWKILLPKRYWYIIPPLLFPVFLFKRITGLCNFKSDLSYSSYVFLIDEV